jgi:iron-sulfur cluster assembly protein
MTVTLTERAAGEIKRMIAEQQLPEDTVLRVGVAGGGCSGFEYRMDFDGRVDEAEDQIDECHGVRVAVDSKSAKFLRGTEIDFRMDLLNRGFVFNNPLATRTCGCGTSFQV